MHIILNYDEPAEFSIRDPDFLVARQIRHGIVEPGSVDIDPSLL